MCWGGEGVVDLVLLPLHPQRSTQNFGLEILNDTLTGNVPCKRSPQCCALVKRTSGITCKNTVRWIIFLSGDDDFTNENIWWVCLEKYLIQYFPIVWSICGFETHSQHRLRWFPVPVSARSLSSCFGPRQTLCRSCFYSTPWKNLIALWCLMQPFTLLHFSQLSVEYGFHNYTLENTQCC